MIECRPIDDIVGDLDQIIDFGPFLDPCPPETGPVNCDVRADLHVVVDLHDAGLGNLHMAPAGEFVSEPVAADDGARMDDNAGADAGALPDGHVRVNVALPRPSDRFLPDENMSADDRARRR